MVLRRLPGYLLILVLFTGHGRVLGQQVVLNDSLEVFGERMAEILDASRSPSAAAIGGEFRALWNGAFSEAQRKAIAGLCLEMQSKGYRPIPYYRDFTGAIVSGVKGAFLSGGRLDRLLEALSLSLGQQSAQIFARELAALQILFDHRALYYANYNRLYAHGGLMDFEFASPAPAASPLEDPEPAVGEDPWSSESAVADTWSNDPWATSGWDTEPEPDPEAVNEKDDGLPQALQWSMPEEALPLESGLVVRLEGIDLVIATAYDSVVLKGCSGTFLPARSLFLGSGGNFDWSVAGMESGVAYAVPGPFSMNVRQPALTAAKTTLHYSSKLNRPVEGHFEYKSQRRREGSFPTYPRFYSYQSGIEISGLGDTHLRYKGGVALEGSRLIGAASDGSLAQLQYHDAQGPKFSLSSGRFDFADSTITARQGSFSLYHGHDSITHPSVKFWYYPHKKELRAVKELDGYTVQPFSSSFFQMTINADQIAWHLEADSLNIGIMNARSMLPAVFKSIEYYNEKEVNELAGVYNFHPLLMAFNYGSKKRTREFYLNDMIRELGVNEKAAKGAMQQLKYLDFIEFEEVSGRIYLKDKTIHYVRSKNNQKDYDELLIPSKSESGPNATLKLSSQELVVRGIEKFYISEILDVYMLPTDQKITLLKNRDFTFDGQVFAGNFEFVGRNFTFRYDSFLVDMHSIDSIRFYVEDANSRYRRTQVDNKMVSLDLYKSQDGSTLGAGGSTSGTLFINRPENKSGRKIYPEYPIFDATRGAVVYFDNKSVLEGAYDKSAYFIVPPFKLDSLSNSDPSTVGFEGVFVSGGILPDIDETLRIMPDNSLGFVHRIPPEGYALYGDKGRLYNQVSLDKQGLVAKGQIDFLSSSGESEAYVLYQDSVLAMGTNFNLDGLSKPGASFPDLYVDNYQLKWLPYQDSMYVRNADDLIRLYGDLAQLDGKVALTPTGVSGSGTMITRDFNVDSESFTFSERDLTARHADFMVGSAIPDKPLMDGEDIRLDFSLDTKLAELRPEVEGDAALEFPYAQFKTSISKATWDLDAAKITMVKPPEIDISQSYFYTTREELDSLAFNAESAEYDLIQQKLRISGIPHIVVADAYIIPENNEVLILENATIGELRNTTIILDTLNEYHRLTDGTINIISRKEFSGTASYQFVTARNDTFNIQLGRFELWRDPTSRNAPLQTRSSGAIAENDHLLISDGMYYKGDVTMYARNRALELNGFVKPDIRNISGFNTWITYQSQSDETQEVLVNFNQAITENGMPLAAGLFHKSFSGDLYFNFLDNKELDTDDEFFRAEGILLYDPGKGVFAIEDTAKASDSKLSGKLFAYNDNTAEVEFEGPLAFMRQGSRIAVEAAGSGRGNVNQIEYELEVTAKLQYDLPEQIFTAMAIDLFEMVENYSPPEAESDRDALMFRLAEFLGDRGAQEFDNRSMSGYVPLPAFSSRMIGSLVFSRLDLRWSPEYNAWYSVESLGLSNILRADINASLEGFLEIQKTQDGDNVNIFIKAAGSSWYYLGYQDNRLTLFSSNEYFNDQVNSRSNVGKAAFGDYVFALGDLSDVQAYIRRFRANYLGITLPYDIRMPVATFTEAAPAPIAQPPVYREVGEDQVEEIIVDKTGQQPGTPAPAYPVQRSDDVEEIVVEKSAEQPGQKAPQVDTVAPEVEVETESTATPAFPVQRSDDVEEIVVERSVDEPVQKAPQIDTVAPEVEDVTESTPAPAFPVQGDDDVEDIIVEKPGDQPQPAMQPSDTAATEPTVEPEVEKIPVIRTESADPAIEEEGKGRDKKKKDKSQESEKPAPEPARKPVVEDDDDTEGF